MSLHALFGYAALAAFAGCLASALAARSLTRPGIAPDRRRDSRRAGATLSALARKLGAAAILLMLASRCAGSH